MVPRTDIESSPASRDEKDNLLSLMREHMADRLERTLQLMGLTPEQFVELYHTRGEVRTLRHRGTVAGFFWCDGRDRELHLHAIFVLPDRRGLGIGSALLGLTAIVGLTAAPAAAETVLKVQSSQSAG